MRRRKRLGLRFDGEVYRQIVFFDDRFACEDRTDGHFEFDARASAVAVTAGAQASSSTQGSQVRVAAASSGELSGAADYYNGMRVFTMTVGGLMCQATVAGQRHTFRFLKQ